jgi:hypothetical protein
MPKGSASGKFSVIIDYPQIFALAFSDYFGSASRMIANGLRGAIDASSTTINAPQIGREPRRLKWKSEQRKQAASPAKILNL